MGQPLLVERPICRSSLVARAEAAFSKASGGIANGYLRSDPQEWVRAVEKRRAALGRKIDV